MEKRFIKPLFVMLLMIFLAMVVMGIYYFWSFPVSDTNVFEPRPISINPVPYDGYLSNPGMGWQHDNSTYSDAYPETVMYTRSGIRWKDLNPADGVYDWSPLDDRIARAALDGKQFSFRVFTMAGEIYGGHEIPGWVLDKGAVILPFGEPDYSNCVYQEEWGRFVNALLQRYDGNPDIAFIDISGYGNFNEWSWSDDQTEWDFMWEQSYAQGVADENTMENLDGEARRRLADMFIGGSFSSHRCRLENGEMEIVEYSYEGGKKTQLIMPYAGIRQSAQYVFSKRDDVGFRYDCLGRSEEIPYDGLSNIWVRAPVVYEFCGPGGFELANAWEIIRVTHPIIIHNNDYQGDVDELEQLLLPIGYRFFLKDALSHDAVDVGGALNLTMTWQNLGTAPVYPKLHDFELRVYLIDAETELVIIEQVVDADLSDWLPADPFSQHTAPEYQINMSIPIPQSVSPGSYLLAGSIIDTRTGLPLKLAMAGEYLLGHFVLFEVSVR